MLNAIFHSHRACEWHAAISKEQYLATIDDEDIASVLSVIAEFETTSVAVR
jgi:hypothetical protein